MGNTKKNTLSSAKSVQFSFVAARLHHPLTSPPTPEPPSTVRRYLCVVTSTAALVKVQSDPVFM